MDSVPKIKQLSPKEALIKAAAFCAYQERTQQQVRDKLYSFGLHQQDVENLIIELCREKFIDEERYAKAYASGKFRYKKWGRNKIIGGMKADRLSAYCVKQGLAQIDPEEYIQTMSKLIEQRWLNEKEKNLLKRKYKVANFVLSKGYESDLIWDVLNKMGEA